MRKKVFLLVTGLCLSTTAYSQVGINNTSPRATMDVTAKNTDGSTSEGIICPRLTGEVLHTANLNNVYGANQDGTIAFVTSPPSVANRVGQTIDIDARGYYYYDFPENKWIKMLYASKAAVIDALNCGGFSLSGNLTSGLPASNVIATIPYTGGNGGTYFSQSVGSTSVTGLTASFSSGTLANGSGNLSYSISGTPSSSGTASFPISFGGQSCNLSIPVGNAASLCGAFIAPGVYKEFMCHNLGADTSADPFTPAAAIHGAKYHWGYKPANPLVSDSRYYTQADDQANSGTITGWNTTALSDGSWQDAVKTANDPCPSGYRLPTLTEWTGVIANNAVTRTGTWSNSPTNYTVAIKLGTALLLPTTGYRNTTNGTLNTRGSIGNYWSSTEVTSSTSAKNLSFNSTNINTYSNSRTFGFSVRCIKDDAGSPTPSVATLDCVGGTTTGSVTSGLPASGVSRTVLYTGGNGVAYTAQTVNSAGVTGLTANLAAGTLANGGGTLTYTITGTPSAAGTASFAISLGGQSCTFTIPVGAALAAGSGSFSGKTCFDVAMVNDGGDCGTLSSRASTKADFSQAATNTQTYTFTPSAAVSNVRFVYLNSNGQVISSISGGNSGNNITGAVNCTVSYNTGLNALASGLSKTNALTASIIVIYNDNATNTGTDKQLTLTVNVQDCSCCGAYVAPGAWKEFMCQNLGADTSVDPFTPSALIHGAKYQWGATTGMAGRYYSQADDQVNPDPISGWTYTVVLPDDSWKDGIKTTNDPCPLGYRVPTQVQWQGVINNNTVTRTGSWATSSTNYTTAIKFGTGLLLPAAGNRDAIAGVLNSRGSYGYYWSSTGYTSTSIGRYMYFASNTASIDGVNRANGYSVRCIKE